MRRSILKRSPACGNWVGYSLFTLEVADQQAFRTLLEESYAELFGEVKRLEREFKDVDKGSLKYMDRSIPLGT